MLLEPTAGQGQSLCSTLDELDEYLHRLEHHPRLGLCIDTCHSFAAGHDLAADGGMNDFLDHLEKLRGGVPVGLIHLNDSLDVVGAKKDRHATIGEGHIGVEPFRDLLAAPVHARGAHGARDARQGTRARRRADPSEVPPPLTPARTLEGAV